MYFNYGKEINNLDAMLLAAGRGERMRYKTKFLAKPLIKIHENSVLERNIIKIANAGIRKIVVNSSYKHLTIKKFSKNFKTRKKLPEMIVTFEKERLETGGGIKNAMQNFKNSNVLIVNGDSHLSNIQRDCPIKRLVSNYNKSYMDVLLLLSKKKNTFGYNGTGDYYKLNYSVASKLTAKNIKTSSKYIFTGWQIINKKIINSFSEKSFSLKRVYDLAEKKGSLYGVEHKGSFFHIGDLKSFTIINKFFKI
ncbi:sugar phosphate nucleotidyltransferase [Alphaproteobacteria bacterium]|nr:sugar phosphate nucleotidyltransferase [Alphaproteobacteria bacterium]